MHFRLGVGLVPDIAIVSAVSSFLQTKANARNLFMNVYSRWLAEAHSDTLNHVLRHDSQEIQSELFAALKRLDAGGVFAMPPGGGVDGKSPVSVAMSAIGSSWGADVMSRRDRTVSASTTAEDVRGLVCYSTSGSTGAAKIVIYSAACVARHAAAVAEVLQLGEESLDYFALTPVRFAYGLSIVFSHRLSMVPVRFIVPELGLRSVADHGDQTTQPFGFYLLPQQVTQLLNAPIDSGRVERVFIAGGRISESSVEALARRFPHLRLTNMYGQAEMGPRLSVWEGSPDEFVEGSIGKPISGARLKLADEERGRNEPVALLASSAHAMWKSVSPPYDKFEGGPASGEFVNTGDVAVRASDGSLIHQGRSDHVLNVAGTKIDVRQVARLVEERYRPIVVRVTSKVSRVAGDVIPVMEIVPGLDDAITTRDVRQTLHADYGNLASLFDVRIVDHLNLGESGK